MEFDHGVKMFICQSFKNYVGVRHLVVGLKVLIETNVPLLPLYHDTFELMMKMRAMCRLADVKESLVE